MVEGLENMNARSDSSLSSELHDNVTTSPLKRDLRKT